MIFFLCQREAPGCGDSYAAVLGRMDYHADFVVVKGASDAAIALTNWAGL